MITSDLTDRQILQRLSKHLKQNNIKHAKQNKIIIIGRLVLMANNGYIICRSPAACSGNSFYFSYDVFYTDAPAVYFKILAFHLLLFKQGFELTKKRRQTNKLYSESERYKNPNL